MKFGLILILSLLGWSPLTFAVDDPAMQESVAPTAACEAGARPSNNQSGSACPQVIDPSATTNPGCGLNGTATTLNQAPSPNYSGVANEAASTVTTPGGAADEETR